MRTWNTDLARSGKVIFSSMLIFSTLALTAFGPCSALAQQPPDAPKDAAPLPPKTADQSWSDYLKFIESDATRFQDLVHTENHLTNGLFNQSKNKPAVMAMLNERLDAVNTVQNQKLANGARQVGW